MVGDEERQEEGWCRSACGVCVAKEERHGLSGACTEAQPVCCARLLRLALWQPCWRAHQPSTCSLV